MSATLVNKDGETETFSLTDGEKLSQKIDGLRKLVNDRKGVKLRSVSSDNNQ